MTTILYRAKNDRNGNPRSILALYVGPHNGRVIRRFRVGYASLPITPHDVVDVTPEQYRRMARIAEDVSVLVTWLGGGQ